MNNNYKKDFLNITYSLDAVVEGSGEITKLAMDIVENKKDESIISLYKRIINIVDDEYSTNDIKRIAIALREAMISYIGYIRLKDICTNEKNFSEKDKTKTLAELLDELNALVGLNKVKEEVNDLISYQKVQKIRKEQGLACSNNTMHMAFTGNPGTGKTTVARIVGQVYKHLGLLSRGHFLEVSRTDLIAGYQGQTALKVKEVIETIKGGVLFIDEAYSITENEHSDSYGRECLTELTKALEDLRDDLVVIVAGYTEPMNKFFESNPGLRSRFNRFIEFEDYSKDELFEILIKMCEDNDYFISNEGKDKIRCKLDNVVSEKKEQFSNGRYVRNLYERITINQARRIANMKEIGKEELMEIKSEDVE